MQKYSNQGVHAGILVMQCLLGKAMARLNNVFMWSGAYLAIFYVIVQRNWFFLDPCRNITQTCRNITTRWPSPDSCADTITIIWFVKKYSFLEKYSPLYMGVYLNTIFVHIFICTVPFKYYICKKGWSSRWSSRFFFTVGWIWFLNCVLLVWKLSVWP